MAFFLGVFGSHEKGMVLLNLLERFFKLFELL